MEPCVPSFRGKGNGSFGRWKLLSLVSEECWLLCKHQKPPMVQVELGLGFILDLVSGPALF